MEKRTQIDLPAQVSRPFEVFVNGIPQVEGTDYELVGSSLVFSRSLEREGSLGFWRWARMVLGIAGTLPQERRDRRRVYAQRAPKRRDARAARGAEES